MTLTRFAPSPTGYLHVGHAYAAAQAFGFGPCLLRIEDIDFTRSKPEFTMSIYEDLRWLGFDWPKPVRAQSAHLADYQQVVATLTARGLTYEDFTTRTGEEDRSRPPTIKLNVKKATKTLPALVYLDNSQTVEFDPSTLPDPTLARRDIGTSYHIAVTHDDALQGITDVVRGQDLADQTPIHVVIQTLMGWPIPRYHHHGLIMEADGKKMSKRKGSQTIASLRAQGMSAEEVLALARSRVAG